MHTSFVRGQPRGTDIQHPTEEGNHYLIEDITESARTREVPQLVVMAKKEDVMLACRHALVGKVDDTRLIEHIFDIAVAQQNGKLRQWIARIGSKSRYASDALKEKLAR